MKRNGKHQIKGRRCAQHYPYETLLPTLLLSLSGMQQHITLLGGLLARSLRAIAVYGVFAT